MTKPELLKRLDDLYKGGYYDPEEAHIKADQLLLEFINDKEVTKAYDRIDIKWYA